MEGIQGALRNSVLAWQRPAPATGEGAQASTSAHSSAPAAQTGAAIDTGPVAAAAAVNDVSAQDTQRTQAIKALTQPVSPLERWSRIASYACFAGAGACLIAAIIVPSWGFVIPALVVLLALGAIARYIAERIVLAHRAELLATTTVQSANCLAALDNVTGMVEDTRTLAQAANDKADAAEEQLKSVTGLLQGIKKPESRKRGEGPTRIPVALNLDTPTPPVEPKLGASPQAQDSIRQENTAGPAAHADATTAEASGSESNPEETKKSK